MFHYNLKQRVLTLRSELSIKVKREKKMVAYLLNTELSFLCLEKLIWPWRRIYFQFKSKTKIQPS